MILIDTNLYSALDKGVASAIGAVKDQAGIYIPIMVVAELKFGFKNGNKHEINEQNLYKFLSQHSVEVLYPTLETSDSYADLALYSRQKGKALSNNDLWIASIAKENNVRLVTYDKDFEVFSDIFADKLLLLNSEE